MERIILHLKLGATYSFVLSELFLYKNLISDKYHMKYLTNENVV